jgi:hypothetical protein
MDEHLMLPVPTILKAVREDPAAPLIECYPGQTPDALREILAVANPTTIGKEKGQKTMSHNYTGYDGNARKLEISPVPGINASDNPQRLIDVLSRLDLISDGMAEPLKILASHGKPLAEHYQVSVYKLDIALAKTGASLENRIGFKASLNRHGLLSVPR